MGDIKSLKEYVDSVNGEVKFDESFWNLEPVRRMKEMGKSDSQIKKFTFLAKTAGSIKLSYPVDSVQLVNELRGKSTPENDTEDDLVSLVLWSIRRLPKVHQKFAYEELTSIVGEDHRYLEDIKEEIKNIIK